jgi:hypothetical protein
VKKEKKDSSLPDGEVLLNLWDSAMDAVQWSGKNQQQNTNLALKQVRSVPEPGFQPSVDLLRSLTDLLPVSLVLYSFMAPLWFVKACRRLAHVIGSYEK